MTDRIDCAEQCEIPDGIQLIEVPRPRHAWGDVLNCPNDGCGRSFMTKTAASSDGPSVQEAAADDRRYWDVERYGD